MEFKASPAGELRATVGAVCRDMWAAARAGYLATFASWTSRHVVSAIVLIDLDGWGVRVDDIPAALAALRAVAGPRAEFVAAGHPIATRSARQVCQRLDVEVLPTTRQRNSADDALLAFAYDARRRGVVRTVVVAHDSDFCRLPDEVTLVVFVRPDLVSARLRARAHHTIDLSERPWHATVNAL